MPQGKLVRDLIPDIIRAHGGDPIVEQVEGEELYAALLAKLDEETQELRGAANRDDAIAELADVLEVVRAIADHFDLTLTDLEDAANTKRDQRGGFTQGLFLIDGPAGAGSPQRPIQ